MINNDIPEPGGLSLAELITTTMTSEARHPLNAGMGNPGGNARYGQGQILEWNESTFENVVRFRGADLVNLSVLSGPDALSYRAGDIVAIMSWSPQGGASVFWIMGKVITPGAGRAAEAIEWMTGSLGRAIASAVLADRVVPDDDPASGVRTASGFGNLDSPADPGPQVTVDISNIRRALVFATARIGAPLAVASGTDAQVGIVGVRVSGQSIIAPDITDSLYMRYRSNTAGHVSDVTARATAIIALSAADGLQSGNNIFTLEYSTDGSDNRGTVTFSERQITVIGF